MIRVRNGTLSSVALSGTILADVTDRAGRLLGVVTQGGPFIVSGANAEGVAASGSPVRIAGSDAGGLVRTVFVNAADRSLLADVSDRAARLLGVIAEMRAATLHVTGTAAVNTALTITLPAAGAGLFHYITAIEWVKLYSVVGIAAGAGVIITSTNLPGGPAWTTEQLASPAGTVVRVIDYHGITPLKSLVANTATTIVAPLQLQTIWRANVSYFTGT